MDGLKPDSLRRTDALGRMGRAQLESLLARYCRAQGYAVESAATATFRAKFGDAIDLVLRRDDEFVLVQCRHWTAATVAQDAVQALLDVMADLDATGGVLVTGGSFSSAAVEVASQHGRVELVDARTLQAMFGPMAGLDDEPPLSGGHGDFDRSAHFGDNNDDWLMPPAGDPARFGALATAPPRPLLLSLGLKVTFGFALILLFAWLIDAAVHPLLQPLRMHRITAPPALPVSRQDAVDEATPDAWHQPSEDEFLEQQRKADGAVKAIHNDAPDR